MNKIWLSFVAVTALAWPVWGQKVEVQKPDRGQILHVQTALNHLTVLEMTEAVSTVAVGSPVFRVEWRENKSLSNRQSKMWRRICLCGRRPGASTTSSTLRDPCRKWISRLTNQLLIHQLPLFLRVGRASPVVRRRRKC